MERSPSSPRSRTIVELRTVVCKIADSAKPRTGAQVISQVTDPPIDQACGTARTTATFTFVFEEHCCTYPTRAYAARADRGERSLIPDSVQRRDDGAECDPTHRSVTLAILSASPKDVSSTEPLSRGHLERGAETT